LVRVRPPARTRERSEGAARRTLLAQVASLESELAALFTSAFPRTGLDWSVRRGSGPRLLDLAELERLRDALAARLHTNRIELAARGEREQEKRRQLERMMLDPASHRWMRISREEIGEPGCGGWHVEPAWGLLGMLRNWWRVRISSGCP
jgi:hypothetical protein